MQNGEKESEQNAKRSSGLRKRSVIRNSYEDKHTTPVVVSARSGSKLKGRISNRQMEEDWMADAQQADWRRQRAENNLI